MDIKPAALCTLSHIERKLIPEVRLEREDVFRRGTRNVPGRFAAVLPYRLKAHYAVPYLDGAFKTNLKVSNYEVRMSIPAVFCNC